MRHAIVSLSELSKGNKRFCLSAKRALKLCWQCKLYPNCESKIVNAEYDVDMKKRAALSSEYAEKVMAINDRWPNREKFT